MLTAAFGPWEKGAGAFRDRQAGHYPLYRHPESTKDPLYKTHAGEIKRLKPRPPPAGPAASSGKEVLTNIA